MHGDGKAMIKGAALLVAVVAAVLLFNGLIREGEDETKVDQVKRANEGFRAAEAEYFEENGRYAEVSDLLLADPDLAELITRNTEIDFSLGESSKVVTVIIRHEDPEYFSWFSLAEGRALVSEETTPFGGGGNIRSPKVP